MRSSTAEKTSDFAQPTRQAPEGEGLPASTELQLSQIEQVRLALSSRQIGKSLEQALRQAGSSPDEEQDRSAVCRIVYMKYEPGQYCILLYHLGERMVVGHMRSEGAATLPPASNIRIEYLGMEVYPYPMDPWLPGLETASDPQVISGALARALPECQAGRAKVLLVRVAPQRYRPGKRFTLRLDVSLRDLSSGEIASRRFFGKVYHDSKKAGSVYQEMQLLSEIAPAREGKIVLAGTAAYLPELSMILQEPVSGTPLEDLIGSMAGSATAGDPRGWSGMRRAAAALAALHSAGLVTKRQRPIQDELKRFKKRGEKIKNVDERQGSRMVELAEALPAWLGWLDEWGAELSLIHGDCKPSQFLIDDDRVALLDFDHAGMSDPANDVGTFVATLRQLSLRQSLKAHDDAPSVSRAGWLLALEKLFLDEYCSVRSYGEGFRLRVTWYEAAGLLRKALRGFGRSPFSPLPMVLVAEAWRCLAELPAAGPRMNADGGG